MIKDHCNQLRSMRRRQNLDGDSSHTQKPNDTTPESKLQSFAKTRLAFDGW
jgi:hypothetical protein